MLINGVQTMSVKWKIEKNKFPEMQANLKVMSGKKVQVGCKGENAWLAEIHEYGCKIEITSKMRAWLHSHNLHIKNSTKYINIPERSFLRNGFDSVHEKILDNASRILSLVLEGQFKADTFLNTLGLGLATEIKKYAIDLKAPANHPFTIENKGSTNPLVDSGNLVDSIKHSIE